MRTQRQTYSGKGWACDNRDRDWSNVSINQGQTPGAIRGKKYSPLQIQKKDGPDGTLISDF